jgi:hypothetical protein
VFIQQSQQERINASPTSGEDFSATASIEWLKVKKKYFGIVVLQE